MALTIDYRLVGSGWSECTVRFGEAECELSASYLSNALGNLVLAGVAVLAGAYSISVAFDEEPGEYRWSITRSAGDRAVLKVLEFQELWGNRPDTDGKVLLEASLQPLAFGESVAEAASRVLALYGKSGYKEKWVEHDFPEQELALLNTYIAKWRDHDRQHDRQLGRPRAAPPYGRTFPRSPVTSTLDLTAWHFLNPAISALRT